MRSLVSRAAVAAAAALSLAACSDKNATVLDPPAPGNNAAFMARYVALGNSITAGFQSDGITDSTQKQSYARLFAQQAGTDYRYVSIPNGCRPPLASFQTGARVPATQPCALDKSYQYLNNVAVPGATVTDFTAQYSASYSALTSFILGGKSQFARALDVRPTFASVWLGNNDVLSAGLSGVVVATPNVSPGITAVTGFTNTYRAGVDSLTRAGVTHGVLIGVVDVSQVPALFPAESLLTNPVFKAQFDAALGSTSTVLPNCVGSRALVSLAGLSSANGRAALKTISCVKNQPVAGAGELFVLDSIEQKAITAAVTGYNDYIKAKADTAGYAYVDPNPALQALRANGQIPALPVFTSPQPFGAYISLDGVHPAAPAHRIVANAVIDAVNAKYGSAIPKLP